MGLVTPTLQNLDMIDNFEIEELRFMADTIPLTKLPIIYMYRYRIYILMLQQLLSVRKMSNVHLNWHARKISAQIPAKESSAEPTLVAGL